MASIYLIHFAALALGAVYGFVASRTDWCFLTGVKSLVAKQPSQQVHSFVTAMLVSLVLTQLLIYLGKLETIDHSKYLANTHNIISLVIGAMIFSLGMVLANGCPNRHLILLGRGNLRSLAILLVTGISSSIALKGLFALPRIRLNEVTTLHFSDRSLADLFNGIGIPYPTLFAILLLVVLLLVFVVRKGKLRLINLAHSWDGLIIGICIAVGWYLTSESGYASMSVQGPDSLTFGKSMGDTLFYLMTYTGSILQFMTSVIGGVLLGSFIASILGKKFALTIFETPAGMAREMLGGLLMGVGAVMALGCTVGQGLSGFSTLSIGSIVVVITIYLSTLWIIKRH